MRKLITFLSIAALVLSCSTVCLAAEEPDTQTVDVYAKYIGGSAKAETAIPEGADDITVELPDGSDVIVENIPDEAKILVIYPIPDEEEEANAWFEEVTKDKGTELAPYEIYFIDSEGNKKLPNGVGVTMDVRDGIAQPIVLAVDKNNTITEIPSIVKDGKISFTANDSDYYVIAKKLAASGGDVEISDPNPGTSDDVTIAPDSPQTGGNTQMWLWWLLLIVSGTSLTLIMTVHRRKQNKAL